MPSSETIAEFARWWGTEFKGVMCPPCPTKASDLSFTAQMHLRESNATLFQNLFGNGGSGSAPMPADTVARRNQGQCISCRYPLLEAAGLQREANDLKRVAELQETQRSTSGSTKADSCRRWLHSARGSGKARAFWSAWVTNRLILQ